jgi:hypothetical protein
VCVCVCVFVNACELERERKKRMRLSDSKELIKFQQKNKKMKIFFSVVSSWSSQPSVCPLSYFDRCHLCRRYHGAHGQLQAGRQVVHLHDGPGHLASHDPLHCRCHPRAQQILLGDVQQKPEQNM